MRIRFLPTRPAPLIGAFLALAAASFAASAETASTREIEIVSATFGDNCGASQGNVTADLRRHCNGLAECPYAIPLRQFRHRTETCKGDLKAEWRCTPEELHVAMIRHVADASSTLTLSCIEQNGPGH
ncbi:hypothetical protein AWB71_00474 [Caballeronia peredens]|nr:hypothetical protein AWB71_00474 [Caballeronia peredens]